MTPAPAVSRIERLTLLAEHVGNKRLRRLGTALFRRAGGRLRPGGHDVLLLTTTTGDRGGRELRQDGTYDRYLRAAGRVIPLVRLVTAQSTDPTCGGDGR